MHSIIACLDSSKISVAVNQASIWLAKAAALPLTLLHTIEHPVQHGADDLSGYIGLGDSVKLLEEITKLDEKKYKLAREYGKKLLQS